MKSFTLIYTALFCEARAIIEYFGIYSSDDIMLVVGGMSAEKTALHVEDKNRPLILVLTLFLVLLAYYYFYLIYRIIS